VRINTEIENSYTEDTSQIHLFNRCFSNPSEFYRCDFVILDYNRSFYFSYRRPIILHRTLSSTALVPHTTLLH